MHFCWCIFLCNPSLSYVLYTVVLLLVLIYCADNTCLHSESLFLVLHCRRSNWQWQHHGQMVPLTLLSLPKGWQISRKWSRVWLLPHMQVATCNSSFVCISGMHIWQSHNVLRFQLQRSHLRLQSVSLTNHLFDCYLYSYSLLHYCFQPDT